MWSSAPPTSLTIAATRPPLWGAPRCTTSSRDPASATSRQTTQRPVSGSAPAAAAPSRVKSSAAANHRAPPSADGRKLPDPL